MSHDACVPAARDRASKHEADASPTAGIIDPEQARELDKVTMPRYVVEPPDELDITIKPPPPDWNLNTVIVQQDGVIDLGFLGDVYVVGPDAGGGRAQDRAAGLDGGRAAESRHGPALPRLGAPHQQPEQVSTT